MYRFLITLLLATLIVSNAQSAESSLIPEFEPDYRPDLSSAEGGFWYMSDELEKKIQSSPYVVRDQSLNEYISNLVCELAQDYCKNIRVYVIDNPLFNASMYPNGMMHVHSGLLIRVENEAQLAAVLSHEIAHYLRAHHLKRYERMNKGRGLSMVFDLILAGSTGIYLPLSDLGAYADAMAFSRHHETEADLYGAKLLSDLNYDPQASAELWAYVEREREADQSKNNRNVFFASHPAMADRNTILTETASKIKEGNPAAKELGSERYKSVISSVYSSMMKEQLALQEHEQTAEVLARHRSIGYAETNISYFEGELYRQRKGEGDIQKAIEAYSRSTQDINGPVEAYRELGYLYLKSKQSAQALASFEKYRQLAPDASDNEMIDYYITTLRKQ